MTSITLSVPAETRTQMNHFTEMNWSGFVRKCIEEKTQQLSWRENMLKKLDDNAAFEEWAIQMGRRVNEGIANRLRQ